jgi:hypothetical protein
VQILLTASKKRSVGEMLPLENGLRNYNLLHVTCIILQWWIVDGHFRALCMMYFVIKSKSKVRFSRRNVTWNAERKHLNKLFCLVTLYFDNFICDVGMSSVN